MVLDWFVQRGRDVRQALTPKQQPVQAPAPTRPEPATVFYGRGYTRPAAATPARQTTAKPMQPAQQRGQELKKALAPKQQPARKSQTRILPTQPQTTRPARISIPVPVIPPSAALRDVGRVLGGMESEGRLIGTPLASPAADLARYVVRGAPIVTPWDTEARYKEHAAAYDEYRSLKDTYSKNIEGETFVVRTSQDRAKYNRLQAAAEKVETTGKAFDTSRDQELFGVSKRVSDANKRVSSWMNLPRVSPAAERVLQVLIPKSAEERVLGMGLGAVGNPGGARAPEIGQFRLGMVVGGYDRIRTEPLTAAGSLAVGFAGGAVMKGATLIPKVGPLVISKGPTIGKAVDTLYGGSVALRTGMAGPDAFEMGREFGGILTTEAIPMYGGVKAFTAISPRVSAGIARANDAYLSFKIRDAPAARVQGGFLPTDEMLFEGLQMRGTQDPFVSSRSLSTSRYPSRAGTFEEVIPGSYVERGRMDLFLRQYETPGQAAWRQPIPEEFLAGEDIAAAWKGTGPKLDPDVVPKRGIAGGWYPDNEMILSGLRMRDLQGVTTSRSISASRHPSRAGTFEEVIPGSYVERGRMDLFLRQYETPGQAAWRQPIPEEFLTPDDIAEAYKFSSPLLDVPVTKMYAGLPLRPAARQRARSGSRRSAYSLSGRSLRVRPPAADLSLGEAVSARFAAPVTMEPTVSSRSRSDILTALNLGSDLASQMSVDSSEVLKSALNLNSSLALGSVQVSAQEQALTQTSTSRQGLRQRQRTDTTQLRTRISAPRPPRTRVPEVPPLKVPPFPGEGRRKKGRKRKAQTAYDWLVTNPVPDMEFSLGGAGTFDAPARQKGKKSSRRSPVAGPPADFFEVRGF
ncbi:MAG: hypothetical protein PHP55_05760 [Methanoculleus sp.]|nr:hypothetical protein [Methanoculleus sp.]